MSGRKNGKQLSDVFQKLRANHNKKDQGSKKRPDPTSETSKVRKKNEIFERADFLSKTYHGQIIVLMHFPNKKQSSTYGQTFGHVAEAFFESHKSIKKNFFDFCNAADKGVDVHSHSGPEDIQNSDISKESGSDTVPNPGHTSEEVGAADKGVDEDSHASPHNIPYTVPNLGQTSEEVGGEIVEEVVETNQQVLFEMDLDEENDADLTTLDMVLRKYGHLDCEIVPKESTASSSPSAIAGTSSNQEVQPRSPASVQNEDQCQAQPCKLPFSSIQSLPVVLAATPQLIMAPSSPSAVAPSSQPGFESVSLETTTLVKEVLCAKNTVRTYGGKRKFAASSSKSASTSPPKMQNSDRRQNKKSKCEGETKNEDQCQAQPCKLPFSSIQSLPVVLAATPQLIMASSSPSAVAPSSQPGFESVSIQTTTLVKEVLSSGKEVQPRSPASVQNEDQCQAQPCKLPFSSIQSLPVVLAATPQLIMAPSSPSAVAPSSQPGFESVSIQTTTLVKEVLCAKNTVRTYGGKKKFAASSSKSASTSPPKMRKSDRSQNKKSKSEGETKNEDQCQAKPCKLPKGNPIWVQCDSSCKMWFHIRCVGLNAKSHVLKDSTPYFCVNCRRV